MTKKPGILKDPWRSVKKPVAPKRKQEPVAEPSADDDIQNESHATLSLKNYGGITVDGLKDVREVAGHLLNFCVDNIKLIDTILVDHGILVAVLDEEEITLPIYVRRADGWTLMIVAETRQIAYLQLIQAFLALQENLSMKKILTKYHIRPYKL